MQILFVLTSISTLALSAGGNENVEDILTALVAASVQGRTSTQQEQPRLIPPSSDQDRKTASFYRESIKGRLEEARSSMMATSRESELLFQQLISNALQLFTERTREDGVRPESSSIKEQYASKENNDVTEATTYTHPGSNELIKHLLHDCGLSLLEHGTDALKLERNYGIPETISEGFAGVLSKLLEVLSSNFAGQHLNPTDTFAHLLNIILSVPHNLETADPLVVDLYKTLKSLLPKILFEKELTRDEKMALIISTTSFLEPVFDRFKVSEELKNSVFSLIESAILDGRVSESQVSNFISLLVNVIRALFGTKNELFTTTVQAYSVSTKELERFTYRFLHGLFFQSPEYPLVTFLADVNISSECTNTLAALYSYISDRLKITGDSQD